MAFEVPLPSVEPQVGPTPTIHEELPAEATAAGVAGKGLEQLGAGVDKLADVFQNHAMQMAAIDNKTAADAAYGQNLQNTNEYIRNWQKANTGMAAFTNLPQALRDLEAQRSELGSSLQTPMAKVLYEQDSRRSLSYAENDLSRYANEQRTKYVLGQNAAVTQMLISDTIANPDHLQGNQGKLQEQLATQGALVGWSPDELKANYQKVNSAMLSDMIQGMADRGQGVAAQAFLDQHTKSGELTGQDQIRMSTYLKKTNEPGQIANLVDGVISGVVGGAQPSGEAKLDSADVGRAAPAVANFQSKGWSPAAAAGITANLYAESGISPNPKGSNDGGAAYGVFQAHDAYQRSFQEHMGKPIQGSTLQEQEEFLHWDLTAGPDKAVGAQLAAAKTPEDAARIFMLGIERPKNQSSQAIANREAIARQISGGQFEGQAVPNDPLEALQSNLPQMLHNVDSAVDAAFPGEDNAARKDMAEQRLLAQVQRVKTSQDAQYSQSYDKLLTAVADPSIDSIDKLQEAYPGANADIQALPAPMQRSLQRDLEMNANQVTDAKLVTRNQLDGEVVNDPIGFANKGPQYITDQDIPPAWKQHYIDEQQQILKRQKNSTALNQNLNHALALAPVAQGLAQLNITKGSDDYNEFTGAYMGEIEHFEDVHGRKPNDSDLMKIGADLMARQSQTYGIPLTGITWQAAGDPSFHVPQESIDAITQQFQRAKGYTPNKSTIAEIYWRTHAR